MRIDLLWNDETTPVDLLDGLVTLGGAETDGICIAGLPHALLSLALDGDRLTVTAQRSVRIGNALFPARVPRLLVEGEDLKLPNDVILRRVMNAARRDSRKLVGTAFVAQELLSGDLAPQETRAATLTCVTGLDQGRTFPIPFADNVIGRGDDAAIRIRDRAVSRQHARLVRKQRDYVLQGITSSMNGVYVNGRLLTKHTALRTGDVVEVGQTVLRFDNAERAPEERTVVQAEAPKLPKPLAPPGVAEPTPPLERDPLAVIREVSFETWLMSGGIGLTLLGIGAAALMLW